ncbi:MAG: type III-A CRISPR-associated protein Cas10/Csm1 [Caldisericaceae bacterium]
MDESEEKRLLEVAALTHDMGKFMQRGFSVTKSKFDHSELSGYFFDKEATHIELKESEEFLRDLRFLVEHHHEAKLDSLKETTRARVLAEILSEADNISSGERRDKDTQQYKLLESIFAKIAINKQQTFNPDKRFYGLDYLHFGDGCKLIYPQFGTDTSANKIEEMYKAHWNNFFGEFKDLLKSHLNRLSPDSLCFLLEKYLWCVPSAYFMTVPDISLFEHLKTTAAFATSIYEYLLKERPEVFDEKDSKIIREKVKDRKENRYLLLLVDINGIQRFIYDVSSKKGLLSLKGRSFFIQALADLINHYILWDESINLFESNIIYSGGGKSYLLLPLTAKDAVYRIKNELEIYLFEKFGTDVSVSFGTKEASAEDFLPDKISSTWQDVLRSASEDKQHKLKEFIAEKYDRVFGANESGGYFDSEGKGSARKICSICRKEVSESEIQIIGDLEICKECSEILSLARSIRDSNYEIISKGYDEDGINLNKKIYLKFVKSVKETLPERSIVLNIEDTNLSFSAQGTSDSGYVIIGARKPPEDSAELGNLGETAKGINRIGVLRMDVDNLGQIFKVGLRNSKTENSNDNYMTLSRISQLSSSVSMFFKGELGNILLEETPETVPGKRQFKDYIYVIYAGGDDLFAIGSWDKIPDFANEFMKRFRSYACDNPSLTISAGIHLIDATYPISRGAILAGTAEEKAKAYSFNGHTKNAVSFLGETVSWNDFEIASCIKDIIVGEINKSGSKAILRKLQGISALYKKQHKSLKSKLLTSKEIEDSARWSKWMWMLAYYLGRSKQDKETLSLLRDSLFSDQIKCIERMLESDREIISYLDLPLTWADYSTREKKEA